MEKVKVFEVLREGTDYEFVVPKGTKGNEVEIGLAQAFIAITKREQEQNPDFKMDTLFRSIQHWARLICEDKE